MGRWLIEPIDLPGVRRKSGGRFRLLFQGLEIGFGHSLGEPSGSERGILPGLGIIDELLEHGLHRGLVIQVHPGGSEGIELGERHSPLGSPQLVALGLELADLEGLLVLGCCADPGQVDSPGEIFIPPAAHDHVVDE